MEYNLQVAGDQLADGWVGKGWDLGLEGYQWWEKHVDLIPLAIF